MIKRYYNLRWKKLKVLCISLLLSLLAEAQSKNTNLFIQVLTGPSFPVGKFGSKNPSDSSAGWAKLGVAANVSFGYQLTKSAAVIFQLGGVQNKQDAASFESYLNKEYGSNNQAKVNTQSWKIGKVMAGGNLILPIIKSGKVFSSSQVLAGICKTAIPGYSYSITNKSSGFLVSGGSRIK